MTRLEVYGADAVQQGLGMRKALEAVACALYGKRVGRQAWSLVYADLDEQGANMDIRSGSLPEAGLFGLKLIRGLYSNIRDAFPSLCGNIQAQSFGIVLLSAPKGRFHTNGSGTPAKSAHILSQGKSRHEICLLNAPQATRNNSQECRGIFAPLFKVVGILSGNTGIG